MTHEPDLWTFSHKLIAPVTPAVSNLCTEFEMSLISLWSYHLEATIAQTDRQKQIDLLTLTVDLLI